MVICLPLLGQKVSTQQTLIKSAEIDLKQHDICSGLCRLRWTVVFAVKLAQCVRLCLMHHSLSRMQTHTQSFLRVRARCPEGILEQV